MTKFSLILLIIFVVLFSPKPQPQQDSECTKAKFVAYDNFSGLDNPHEPKQVLIAEIQSSDLFQVGKLIKVIYYPKTNGFRGGAKFLKTNILDYKNCWEMKLREPSEEEKLYCEVENFLRDSNGDFDTNEKNEPTLRFHSTQTDADIEIHNLDDMPCMILDYKDGIKSVDCR